MATSKPKPGWLREFCKKVEPLGFTFDGYHGSGHPRFYCAEKDIHVTTALTPSDWRAERNSLAEMERISGRKIHRDNAGHYRHRRHAESDFRTTGHEREVSRQCEELLAECDSMRNRFALLAAQNTRTAAEEAKRLVAKFNHHKERLAEMHRHIPPLSTGDF